MQAKGPNLTLFLAAVIFLADLVLSQKVQRSVGPLECYVCGKAPHKSCDEFDPHDITFRAACGDEMQSCVKSFGAFQNVTVESRRCGEGPALNRCSSISLGGADVLICSCNATLCNTAAHRLPQNSLILLQSFILLVLINNGIGK